MLSKTPAPVSTIENRADVVNRHRGPLDIQNTPGKGSVFTVTLPAVHHRWQAP
jgi:hypothetical protein